MVRAKKQRHEFKYKDQVSTSVCNLYLLKVGDVHYFGFEDIGEGTPIGNAITSLCQEAKDQNKVDFDNIFFFKWYTRYKARGVEQIEFESTDNELHNPTIKRFCDYLENPFF
jgi:hypothetical protein